MTRRWTARWLRPLAPLALLGPFAGCGEDAAKDVPKAVTAPPRPAAEETPKPGVAQTAETAAATIAANSMKPEKDKDKDNAPVAAAAAPAGGLMIVPATSKIEFIGSKIVGGAHTGGFNAFKGLAMLVPEKPELKGIEVDIDATSLFADDPKLADHLKSKDFFEVEKFPTAKFVTTEIKPGGDKGATHTLVGNLTLHGVTKSITIPATLNVEPARMTLKSEFSLNKDDFGITYSGGNVIRPDVVIKLDVVAAK